MKRALVVLVVSACSKDPGKPAEGSNGSAQKPAYAPRAAPTDAAVALDAPTIDAYEDPDPNRAGKRTGLTKGETPEVATEELIRALAVGNVKVSDLIDPKRGVYQKIVMPGAADTTVPEIAKRACGAKAATVARAYLEEMVDAETKGHKSTPDESVHAITCSNEFIAKPDPNFGSLEGFADPPPPSHPMAYAMCVSPHIMEWDEAFHVVFAPDPKRGLALVAIVSTEGGAITARTWAEVAAQLTSPKGCP